jgi:acyl-coenzyme A thioesterase PaaI-like protein
MAGSSRRCSTRSCRPPSTRRCPPQRYLTSEINVKFLRPVFEGTGEIMAEGRVVSLNGSLAVAEGNIIDGRQVVHATATATCVIFDSQRRQSATAGDPESE